MARYFFNKFQNVLVGFILAAPSVLLCAGSLFPNALGTALSALAAELFPALPCLLVSIWEVLHPCVYQFVLDCLLHLLTASPVWFQFLNGAL